MHTTSTMLLLVIIAVAFRATGVIAGRVKPAVRRANFSTTTTLPPSTLPPPGVLGWRGYRRFHVNDSFIGLPVPCTADEKVCFRYNMLLNPKTDRCQPLGHDPPTGCLMTANRTDYERGSGRIYGVCSNHQDPCPGHRMAYDGRCYRKHIVRDVICGCDAEPTPHILGGMECRCSPPPPTIVEQPTRAGRCRIPDFRFPADVLAKFNMADPSRRAADAPTNATEARTNTTGEPANATVARANATGARANTTGVRANMTRARVNATCAQVNATGLRVNGTGVRTNTSRARTNPPEAPATPPNCSAEQRQCFTMGQVWVAHWVGGSGCYPLLQRGPCAKDELVVLSRTEWARQAAVCRNMTGGCPPGQRRMAFDSQCHNAREMELIAPGRIALDCFGEYEVMNFTEVRSHMPGVFNGTCVVFSSSSMTRLTPPENHEKPTCAPGNADLCSISDIPPPEYNYEDNGI